MAETRHIFVPVSKTPADRTGRVNLVELRWVNLTERHRFGPGRYSAYELGRAAQNTVTNRYRIGYYCERRR
jgi:hypothetical protein